MLEDHPTFVQKQGGRSFFTLFVSAVVVFLTIFFLYTGNLIFILFGLVLAFFSCSCFYTLIINELWIITINEGVFSWSFPRWPKSSGEVSMTDVEWMTIDDNSSKVNIGNSHATIASIHLCGHGYRLLNFMEEYYPRIDVEYIESS